MKRSTPGSGAQKGDAVLSCDVAELLELLARIDRATVGVTAHNREQVQVGPYMLLLDPANALEWLNNAYPLHRSAAEPAAIEAMVEAFRERQRKPRLELLEPLWPELARTLLEVGFAVDAAMPLMLCAPSDFRPFDSAHVEVELLSSEADVPTMLAVADRSFGMELGATPQRIERTRRSIREGDWRCALARIDGRPAGVATTTHFGGVAELAGVGTLPEYRRRGVASATSTALLREHFRTDELAWLSAGDEAARAVYARLGFREVGRQLNLSYPAQSPG